MRQFIQIGLLSSLLASFASLTPVSAQQQSQRERPRVGETPEWLRQWQALSPEQRQQELYIKSKTGGSLNPNWDNDPAIRTWRDKNGFNIRPIVPDDPRAAFKMQNDLLGEMKQSIKEQEGSINKKIRQAKEAFFDAKDEERSAAAQISSLQSELFDVDRKWDQSNFSYCPRGNSWASCDHSDAKDRWLADHAKDRSIYDRAIEKAKQQINEARAKGQQASLDLRNAEKEQKTMKGRIESFQGLVKRQRAGEPFLFMPK
jgi:hypothetical protein